MNLPVVVLIGAVLGALDGIGLFFSPEEPYKGEVFVAAALKGVLTAVIIGLSLLSSPETDWWRGLAFGALYGLAFGALIYFAKGGAKSGDAPLVMPVSAVSGAIAGVLIASFAF